LIYLLDTNVLSALRRPDRAPQVMRWLARQQEDTLFLSVITLGEIERGIAQQQARNPGFADDLRNWLDRTTTLFADRVLPLDAPAARIWGQLSARLGHTGADLLIAATALSVAATVVTGDAGFAATGVRVENPF
jgi:toxin FitB